LISGKVVKMMSLMMVAHMKMNPDSMIRLPSRFLIKALTKDINVERVINPIKAA
jgi:hypothetical protein